MQLADHPMMIATVMVDMDARLIRWLAPGSRKSPGEDTGCAHADDVCLGQKVKHARPARPDLLDPRRCACLQGRES